MWNKSLLKQSPILFITLSGVLMGLVFLSTYLLSIKLPFGYVHFGYLVIFITAAIFPWDIIFAASLGLALSDLVGGYAQYIPFTISVSLMIMIIFAFKTGKQWYWFLIKGTIISLLVMLTYFIATTIYFGVAAAIPGLWTDALQGFLPLIIITIPLSLGVIKSINIRKIKTG